MGSVSDSYRCPLCGRTGNGGYHVDGLGIGPICTDGDYACLGGFINGNWTSVADFFMQAIGRVFQEKYFLWNGLPPELRERVAALL